MDQEWILGVLRMQFSYGLNWYRYKRHTVLFRKESFNTTWVEYHGCRNTLIFRTQCRDLLCQMPWRSRGKVQGHTRRSLKHSRCIQCCKPSSSAFWHGIAPSETPSHQYARNARNGRTWKSNWNELLGVQIAYHKSVLTIVCFREKHHTTHQVNPLALKQNGWHFADNIFKWNFLNVNIKKKMLITISLSLAPVCSIKICPALL